VNESRVTLHKLPQICSLVPPLPFRSCLEQGIAEQHRQPRRLHKGPPHNPGQLQVQHMTVEGRVERTAGAARRTAGAGRTTAGADHNEQVGHIPAGRRRGPVGRIAGHVHIGLAERSEVARKQALAGHRLEAQRRPAREHKLVQVERKLEVQRRLALAACMTAGALHRLAQACRAGAQNKLAPAACMTGAQNKLAPAACMAGAQHRLAQAACKAGAQNKLAQAACKAGAQHKLAQAACRAGVRAKSTVAWQVDHTVGDWRTVDHMKPMGTSCRIEASADRKPEPPPRKSSALGHCRTENFRLDTADFLRIAVAVGRKIACHIHFVGASWRKETRTVYKSCQRRERFWCR